MLALALALLVTAPEPVAVRKGPLDLSNAVDYSTLICIGTVERVETTAVPHDWAETDSDLAPTQAPLGRIAIERVLKGDPSAKVAYHETWSSWVCGSTSAHAGERRVFFLHPGAVSRANSSVRDAATAALGTAPVLRIVGSGDGFALIQEDKSGPFVSFGHVPDALLSVPTGGFRDSFERAQQSSHIPLGRFAAYVETRSRFDRANLAVSARVTSPVQEGQLRFDLRILPNGDARLALGNRNESEVRTFSLPRWDALRAELFLAGASEDASFSRGDRDGVQQRELVIRLDGHTLQFDDYGGLSAAPVDPARRAAATHRLRAWSLLRGAIECPECVDHRSQDSDWLNR
jgi:hypothetical protein